MHLINTRSIYQPLTNLTDRPTDQPTDIQFQSNIQHTQTTRAKSNDRVEQEEMEKGE